MKKVFLFVSMVAALALSACNSNDDVENGGIEIPGITFDDDENCCVAEDALRIYNFLQTVKNVPELTTEVEGKYVIYAYSATGGFHKGYNYLYFVATKRTTGNYVKYFTISDLTPLMYMTKMNMSHSTPVSDGFGVFDAGLPAIQRGWVSFLMDSGEGGTWSLSYDVKVLNSEGGVEKAPIQVDALPTGQAWLKSFKVGADTYYLSLVNPLDWATGTNAIQAYVSKKSADITTPYALASEEFTIEIDPRMPDMGNHTSPNNEALTLQSDGAYRGTVNLTMTGLWRIHLTVRDAAGNVVGGGDDLDNGLSSLYWDVTL